MGGRRTPRVLFSIKSDSLNKGDAIEGRPLARRVMLLAHNNTETIIFKQHGRQSPLREQEPCHAVDEPGREVT